MAGLGLPPVHWSIGGQPVILADWSANASAGAGFDQMRGVISSFDAQIMPQSIMQGSIISGWSEYGRVVFEGRLSAAPKIDQGGTATIVAQGRVSEARKRQSRLLFYSTNATLLQDPSRPPFSRVTYGAGSDVTFVATAADPEGIPSYPQSIGTGKLEASGGSLTSGQAIEAFVYIPDARLKRIRGFVLQSTGLNRIQIRTMETLLGPSVTVAELYTGIEGDLFSAGSAGTIDVQIPGDGAAGITIAFVPTATTLGVTMYGFELWGERLGDIIYSEEAAVTIADRLGWDDSGVQAVGGADIRPMDWQGPWDQAISYAAALDGACWGVYEDERGYGPRLDYGNYGRRTWQVSSAGASWDLQPLEITNRVNVAYVSGDGRDNQLVLDADPDPLAPVGLTNEIRATMNDRQNGFDLATTYGTNLLKQGSKQLYAGRVACVSAMDTRSGLDAPFEIRGGDLLTIADFNQTDPLTVRVSDVEYGPNVVTIGVEEPAVPMGGGSAAGVTTPGPIGGGGLGEHPAAPIQSRNDQPSVSYFEAANNYWAWVNSVNKWNTGWGK